jgi:hypothetical protein
MPEESELSKHLYEEFHKMCLIDPNTTYRKCKESAHTPLVAHLISEIGSDMSPTRSPIIEEEGQLSLYANVPFLYTSSLQSSRLYIGLFARMPSLIFGIVYLLQFLILCICCVSILVLRVTLKV